ncbi:MAG: hypothetical protein ABW221_06600 [Vicinamibacteria bacterium]
MAQAYLVDGVQLSSFGPSGAPLVVLAHGHTRTSGWTNGRLVPVVYVQPPPDGIWDMAFEADPPTGIVLQVLSPIAALYVWTDPPKGVKGVRVLAEVNSKEALVAGCTPTKGHVALGGDKPYPWGVLDGIVRLVQSGAVPSKG